MTDIKTRKTPLSTKEESVVNNNSNKPNNLENLLKELDDLLTGSKKTETKTIPSSNSNNSLSSYITPNGSDSEDKSNNPEKRNTKSKPQDVERIEDMSFMESLISKKSSSDKIDDIESLLADLDNLGSGKTQVIKNKPKELNEYSQKLDTLYKEDLNKKSEITPSNYEEEFVDISRIIVGKVFPDDKEDVFKDLKFTSQGVSSEPALRIDCNNGEALLIINKKHVILQKPIGKMIKYRKTKQTEAEEMEKAVNKIMPYYR